MCSRSAGHVLHSEGLCKQKHSRRETEPGKYALRVSWRRLALGAAAVFLLAGFTFMAAAAAMAGVISHAEPQTGQVPIKFWNRVIAFQRVTIGGASPEDRAERASQRLAELPLNASPDEIVVRPVKVENQDGVGFGFRGRLLFFLGTNDLDTESGEKLDQATDSALRNIKDTLEARRAERSWPVIRRGLLYVLLGLALLIALCGIVWKVQAFAVGFMRKREARASLTLFRIDLLPYLAAAFYGLLRVVAWFLTISLVYLWITLSLGLFPYTEPWAEQAGGYVLNAIRELGMTILQASPGLFMVVLIFLLTRWLLRIANLLFDQVATGRITLSWMDADVARATQRIFSAILWIFAIVVAYPYIPGSQTAAFKGLSVFLGLMVSLGSTGILNQIMSGLFVVYSKALRTGEWVRVNETEGEVLEVGLLAAKVRTVEGQEVTIPNSVLVGTSTTNYTRLGHPEGMIASATVTIGYDAPWRQVHALLELAADRTLNIRKVPKPYVLQRQLSDFYVQYTLIAHLDKEQLRVETVSKLHAAIQDAFNEFGVQIMSPHYMLQPDASVTVPRGKWSAPPSTVEVGATGGGEQRDSSHPKK